MGWEGGVTNGSSMMGGVIHVQVYQQCIVRGGVKSGVKVEVKQRSKEHQSRGFKGTTKPLMAIHSVGCLTAIFEPVPGGVR